MENFSVKFGIVVCLLTLVGALGYMVYDISTRSSSPIMLKEPVLNYYQVNTAFGYQTHVTFLSGKIDTETLDFQGKYDFELGKIYTITYYKNSWTNFRTIVDIVKID